MSDLSKVLAAFDQLSTINHQLVEILYGLLTECEISKEDFDLAVGQVSLMENDLQFYGVVLASL